jgi:hypothetical protein
MIELSGEGTTPATNLVLALEAIVALLYLERFRDIDLWKVRVWQVADLWNAKVSRRMAPIMLVVALLYFVVTHLMDGSFLIYVVYQALCIGFAFLGYGLLALKRRLPGAALAWAGLLLVLAGAVLQRTGIEITLIWTFDHNGVFHLFQLFGVALLVLGLGRSLARA